VTRLRGNVDEPVRRYFAHAIGDGAPPATRFRFGMTGRIRVGRLWLPFSAEQELAAEAFDWRARVGRGLLQVTDLYVAGTALTEGRLLGRRTLFRADDRDTVRSAAGRAALEACAFAPATVLPQHGVTWRAESDELIVAAWELPPERPEVRVRIDRKGAIRSVGAERWNAREHRYVACGADVHAEQRFGAFTVPLHVTVSWWYGSDRATPFFTARLRDFAPA
jgi:uncharacterized protein DUF6544